MPDRLGAVSLTTKHESVVQFKNQYSTTSPFVSITPTVSPKYLFTKGTEEIARAKEVYGPYLESTGLGAARFKLSLSKIAIFYELAKT